MIMKLKAKLFMTDIRLKIRNKKKKNKIVLFTQNSFHALKNTINFSSEFC